MCVRVPLHMLACLGWGRKILKDIAVFSKLHFLIVRRVYISGNLLLGTFLGALSFCTRLDNSTHLFMLIGVLILELTKPIPP